MADDVLRETSIEGLPLVPARILNEYAYCPRLAYLEWVQGEFEESADTLDGSLRHRTVDLETGSLPDPREQSNADAELRVLARSVLLSSEAHGLIARMDLVESAGDCVMPVDYKRGKTPDTPERSWEPDRVQLCAQGLILRNNGYKCHSGVIYYSGSKSRIEVDFDEALVGRTLELLADLRSVCASEVIPPPLAQSRKCEGCSLAGICLPDEVTLLAKMKDDADERRKTPVKELRRLVPSVCDLQPVYVLEQGASVSKKGDLLQVKKDGSVIQKVRLLTTSQLNVFGNVQVSTQLLRELGDRDVSVCYFTYGGWFAGMFSGMGHKNVELRRKQFALAEDPQWSFRQASQFVAGKIRNSRTLLRRNSSDPRKAVLTELSRLASRARVVESMDSLLGVEGAAARLYFSRFATMLKPRIGEAFDFRNRNRRPPKDPINALLSFVYGLLVKDINITLLSVGFDPMMGFLHRPRYGKPALALDLAEEFRPIVGDSVVLTLVNGGEVSSKDFIERGGALALTPHGRRKVIGAYERRLSTEVRHPVFGYSVSYRRVMEIQARLLARRIAGEIPEYLPIVTR